MSPLSFRLGVALAAAGAAGCSGGGGGGGGAAAPRLDFGPAAFATTGSVGARALRIADFDRDGLQDVVVVHDVGAKFAWLRGRGDRTLDNGVVANAPLLAQALAVGHLDADRQLDLIVAGASTASGTLAFAPGAVPAGATANVALPWPVQAMELVDWDGDGNLDLVAVSATLPDAALLRGNGSGGFHAPTMAALPYLANAIAVFDADGDRRPDLLLAAFGAARVDLLANNGAGGFRALQTSVTPALAGIVAVADVDRDGNADVLALDSARQRLLVLRGGGLGGFALVGERSLGVVAHALAIDDLDGDGLLDAVMATTTGIGICYGAAAGTFGPFTVLHRDPRGIGALAAADLDGDGRIDLVYLSGSDRVGVLRNPQPAPAGLANLGLGTADCRGRIGMWANGAPRAGNAGYAYLTTNAPPSTAGVLLQGGPPDAAGSDPFGLGLRLHIAPGVLASRLVFSDAQGRAVHPEPVPANAGLVGLTVYVQSLWLGSPRWTCSISPGGYASSVLLASTVQP
jgi:hypothetical protein